MGTSLFLYSGIFLSSDSDCIMDTNISKSISQFKSRDKIFPENYVNSPRSSTPWDMHVFSLFLHCTPMVPQWWLRLFFTPRFLRGNLVLYRKALCKFLRMYKDQIRNCSNRNFLVQQMKTLIDAGGKNTILVWSQILSKR